MFTKVGGKINLGFFFCPQMEAETSYVCSISSIKIIFLSAFISPYALKNLRKPQSIEFQCLHE